MQTLNARMLTLDDVERLLPLIEAPSATFRESLQLEPLTTFEQQELEQIRNDFLRYLSAGKVSEGQVKFLVLAPLMRLAGFYQLPLEISLEEDIADLVIQDEDIVINGRIDILTVEKMQNPGFWVLVIEAKNSAVDVFAGLPQLLTYVFNQLKHQSTVWGLVTNGRNYLFCQISQDNPSIYRLLPELSLSDPERLVELLQVLKAIAKLQSNSVN
jgi:hypothetical protein